MKLTLNLTTLIETINEMRPQKKGAFNLEYCETSIDKVDLELSKGKEVALKDVEVDSGLLGYQGRHVTLYIKANGKTARFHISDCKTLQGMRASGRFERYVVTNQTSGEFIVDSVGREITTRLKVCQNCLRKLNYKGCNSGNSITKIVQEFDMKEFFATYSSLFHYLPSRSSDSKPDDYTLDWSKVSSHYRVEKNFGCEQCGVNMRTHKSLLHVHHINGVKADNRLTNLKALCVDCHSKQPKHNHMLLTHKTRKIINDLRREQGLLSSLDQWSELFTYADPAVHGVLHTCRYKNLKMPEVNHFVVDAFDEIVARIELAWPNHQFGVAISSSDILNATEAGWTVISVDDFLSNHAFNLYYLSS